MAVSAALAAFHCSVLIQKKNTSPCGRQPSVEHQFPIFSFDSDLPERQMTRFLRIALFVFVMGCFGAAQGAAKKVSEPSAPKAVKVHGKHSVHPRGKTRVAAKHQADISGKTRTGKASFYSHRLAGNKMANGERMDPKSNNAASKTLPLGTRARVTNLHNGKSAVVVIKDRGPYVKGRIVDLSPATAKMIGAEKHGVVPVEVTPLTALQSGKPEKSAG